MKNNRLLLSGDYWHADFQTLLASINIPMLMTPIESLSRFDEAEESFDLILIAQSRRNQVDESVVQFLNTRFPSTPIVFVLGSWCEGEPRSGERIEQVHHIYWHQWLGQFDRFLRQLNADGVTDWHAPTTSTPADRIEKRTPKVTSETTVIGVSAWTQTHYEMIADGLKTIGYRTNWLERCTWDAKAMSLLSAICVDADSITVNLQNRLNWLKSTFSDVPIVLILNFPRSDEVAVSKELGVSQVVSKPFDLDDLQAAVTRAAGRLKTGDTSVIG